jgi:rhodanese-related sulfurtransferase
MNGHRLREVDPQTLKGWLDRGEAILVDVREEDEYARERIAGARHLPLSRLERSAVPHEPGKALVLQCNSGNRSAKTAARLALPEATRLYHLAGGIQSWKRAGARGRCGMIDRRRVWLAVHGAVDQPAKSRRTSSSSALKRSGASSIG